MVPNREVTNLECTHPVLVAAATALLQIPIAERFSQLVAYPVERHVSVSRADHELGSHLVVGYAYAQTRSDDLLRHPDAVTLGPIGARTPEQAEACVYAAVDWARQHASLARIAITGPHPALSNLLEAGFRIGEVETFCASDDARFVDVRRYIPSGGDLF